MASQERPGDRARSWEIFGPQQSGLFTLTQLRRAAPIFIILALATALAALGLTNHLFWDDEANTAIFARNFLRFGELTAWDGTNLIGFRVGIELNDALINTFAPPFQYYVAALGMALFGETTLGARILFVVTGIAALWLLYLWARRHFDSRLPSWLPPLLLAVCPAYLLYIRQARYYPLGMAFTLALLIAWASVAPSRRSFAVCYPLGVAATVALIFTNYLNAAACLAMLPVFMLLARYRTRQHLQFLSAVYATAAVVGVYILLARNPFAVEINGVDPTPAMERFVTLLWWNSWGLGVFEFMPVLMVPLLALPWLVKRLRARRLLAIDGMVVVLAMAVAVVITTLFSPQNLKSTPWPDMRYLVPLIALGATVTAIGLALLWTLARPLAVVVGVVVMFSNLVHGATMAERPLACTLCDYVHETLNDYTTGNEAVIDYLRSLPDGTEVLVRPGYMIYPAMFYLPNLHYCWQLSAENMPGTVDLPAYVENGGPCIGRFLVGGVERATVDQRTTIEVGKTLYAYEGTVQTHWYDGSRPEIPWHRFGPAPEVLNREDGFLVFRPAADGPDAASKTLVFDPTVHGDGFRIFDSR